MKNFQIKLKIDLNPGARFVPFKEQFLLGLLLRSFVPGFI